MGIHQPTSFPLPFPFPNPTLNMKFSQVLCLVALLLVAQTAVAQQSIFGIIDANANGDYDTLNTLLNDARFSAIKDILDNADNTLTLFAPSDDAFTAAGIDTTNTDLVAETLKMHLVSTAAIASTDLAEGTQVVDSTAGDSDYVSLDNANAFQKLQVTLADGTVTVGENSATVETANVEASNGFIHIVDKVIAFPSAPSVVATAAGLDALVQALTDTNLASTVDGAEGITIFAPLDTAFDAATIADADATLRLHILEGVFYSADLAADNRNLALKFDDDDTLQVKKDDNGVTVATTDKQVYATVTIADIPIENGVVHVIDKVINAVSTTNNIAQNAALVDSVSTLYSVVTSDGYEALATALSDESASLTVFAPTDTAFASATFVNTTNNVETSSLVLYHVLGSQALSTDLAAYQIVDTLLTSSDYQGLGASQAQHLKITKDDTNGVRVYFGLEFATVTTADVQCSNGVIHVVDTVLNFPKNVADTATDAGLSSLVSAIGSVAGLAEQLVGIEGMTVFAPTNQAFSSAGTIDDVQATLEFHVVAAVAFSTDLQSTQVFTTVGGKKIQVDLSDAGTVTINEDATVSTADVIIDNGVVHVIDKVLELEDAVSPASALSASLSFVAMLVAFLGMVMNH